MVQRYIKVYLIKKTRKYFGNSKNYLQLKNGLFIRETSNSNIIKFGKHKKRQHHIILIVDLLLIVKNKAFF